MKKTDVLFKEEDIARSAENDFFLDAEDKRKKRRIIIPIAIVLAVLLAAAAAFAVLYKFVPATLTVNGRAEDTADVFCEYTDPGATAEYLFFNISDRVVSHGKVDTEKLGSYSIDYTLSFFGKDYSITRKVEVTDTLAPTITLEGEKDGQIFSSVELFKEPGYTASDNYDGDLTDKVEVTVEQAEGSAKLIYTATDTFGNKAYAERTIVIKDVVAPVITLNGDGHMDVTTPSFADPGFEASDDLDGDLTAKVKVDTDYVSGKVGDYTFTYTVSDKAGNVTTASRTVTVTDACAPTITLGGQSSMYLYVGDTYSEHGATANDDFEGTKEVTVSGSVDTSKVGTYTVTYSASDSLGHSASATRTVVVSIKPEPVSGGVTGNGFVSDSTIYLTFDDGPSTITPQVLDILAAENVKATFFIINYSDGNKSLVQRAISEGHTVAVHCYSHDYATIYRSTDAFIENITKLRDKIEADFGYSTNIIRFPGGSSNVISKKHCPGIMTKLCPLVTSLGYTYFDWNVESGDASGYGIPSSTLYNNVVRGLKKGRGNVVLFHDAGGKTTTPEAVRQVIRYGKANGYTFAGLSSSTPPVHHGINN